MTGSTKSERSIEDDHALMGVATNNLLSRLAVSLGKGGPVEIDFQAAQDVPQAGVLVAVPALLEVGLLECSEAHFQLRGYYPLSSIFLLLALMSLCRLKSIEALRQHAPGEWGKLLGMDRIPEPKTLREKIRVLAEEGTPVEWMMDLSRHWMGSLEEESEFLYVDGHVRVYHGHQTQLPKLYTARSKLRVRATIDYWVNALDGQPFYKVNKEVNPGLLQTLEKDIVPQLLADVPHQPSEIELLADPYLHRFVMVFDREGYSPDFFRKMRAQHIACITYHKYPGEDWPLQEFHLVKGQIASGCEVEMMLAERGTQLSNGLWVREIRKLTESLHQTAILSTDFQSDALQVSVAMFARWSQENFFRYMRQHFNLDGLIDYKLEDPDGTLQVVNPAHRTLDGEIRKKVAILYRRLATFAVLEYETEIEPGKMEDYQQKKATLNEEIEELRSQVDDLKSKRRETSKHIQVADLPPEERFKRLSTQSKCFIDTIKMIAYRAETALTHILQDQMSHPKAARSLLQAIYQTEANLIPDLVNNTLTVELHHMVNRKDDRSVEYLCEELNDTETCFPGTNLRLLYKLVS